MKKILALLAVIILVVAAIAWQVAPKQHRTSIDATTIANSFNDIAELAVEDYRYTAVGKHTDEGYQLLGKKVPLTGNFFLITYKGDVKAGVKNFDAITVDINDSAKTVTVQVPRAVVLSSTIDPNSIEQYDQSFNPFNQLSVSDVSRFLSQQERAAEGEAIDGGLLTRADAHTEQLLTAQVNAMLQGTDKADYKVKVDFK